MSLAELTPEAQRVADTIYRSYDGRTDEQRFYESTVEPRILWASSLAVWETREPQIIRGTE